MVITNRSELKKVIDEKIANVRIADMHTHLFDYNFEKLNLYGIDELLTYHYLVSETFRLNPLLSYEEFNKADKKRQAEIVWQTLFVDNTPVSEVTRSIVTVFKSLGLDTDCKDLEYYRNFFANLDVKEYADKVFDMVGLDYVVMTNDPFDDMERAYWEKDVARDMRFKASLRVDVLLNTPEIALPKLVEWGVISNNTMNLTAEDALAIRGFLAEWIDKIDAMYCAVSLPPDFKMGDGSVRSFLIENCIIPVCIEKNIPFGMMIGVRRQVNPYLGLAGDASGKVTLDGLEYVCKNYPQLKVLSTVLTLEDQHGIVVLTRKFKNLMLFGCWWFVNNPSLIASLTKMRLEMLGTSFIPQHSDCRVFEQLISKWAHSKVILAKVLEVQYGELLDTGYPLQSEQVERDIDKLFSGNYKEFIER